MMGGRPITTTFPKPMVIKLGETYVAQINMLTGVCSLVLVIDGQCEPGPEPEKKDPPD